MMTEKQREQCAKVIYPKIFASAHLVNKGAKSKSLIIPVAFALQELPFARDILHRVEPLAGYTLKKDAVDEFCEAALASVHERHKKLYKRATRFSCIPYLHRFCSNLFLTAFELIAWEVTESLYRLRGTKSVDTTADAPVDISVENEVAGAEEACTADAEPQPAEEPKVTA